MPIKKTLNVKDGRTYMNKKGEEKNSYQQIGRLIEGEYGDFIFLDRHINLSGFPHDPTKGNSIAVSLFDPKGKEQELDDDLAF